MATNLAFIFPGQGSQHLGMLSELASEYSIVQQTFEHASDVLGYDLWQLVQQGPEDKLSSTVYTQPALLVASYAIWQLWQQFSGAAPSYMTGHSLGEYSALLCAEAISFSDAVKLVALRGKFMQQAVTPGEGAMAAIIGLDNQKVAEVCEASAQGEAVIPANYNAIGQVVVAGTSLGVDRVMAAAKEAGAKLTKKLAVSVPSHCPLMQPAADELAEALSSVEIKEPNVPIINNVAVATESQPKNIKASLVLQLTSPVRWVEIVQLLHHSGVTDCMECGPGKVLSGLIRRIERGIKCHQIDSPSLLKAALGE